jgi:hypothetical protein
MNDKQHKIVRITNIADFDFTSEMGSRYDQTDFFVPAGKSLLVPYMVGDHLATHLARQIIMRKSKVGETSDRPLWDENLLEEVKRKILVDVYEEEPEEVLSEGQMLAKKVSDLNKNILDETTLDASKIIATESNEGDIVAYKDKAQVIAELNKRGVKFNARETKLNLEKLLK